MILCCQQEEQNWYISGHIFIIAKHIKFGHIYIWTMLDHYVFWKQSQSSLALKHKNYIHNVSYSAFGLPNWSRDFASQTCDFKQNHGKSGVRLKKMVD